MPAKADFAIQEKLLARVSRSFAFTIPQLPKSLRRAAGNAYLLCRIADTIEDDPGLPLARKRAFFERLSALAAGREEPEAFARELHAALSERSREQDRQLVARAPLVMRINRALPEAQRGALARCAGIMTSGMMEFQARRGLTGLADVTQLQRYCYFVAGVFGEMLTELFCDYSPRIDAQREKLMPLAVSYGQGLQMTNILKDIWEDRRRGACWLPRDVFETEGIDLQRLPEHRDSEGFALALAQVLGFARGHLGDALRYVKLLPATETGIRRYCLWATGMAVLSLRRIHANPHFRREEEVRISRAQVRGIIAATSVCAPCNPALSLLFAWLNRGLPGASRTLFISQ